jgi:hypothetical protein
MLRSGVVEGLSRAAFVATAGLDVSETVDGTGDLATTGIDGAAFSAGDAGATLGAARVWRGDAALGVGVPLLGGRELTL